MRIFSPGCISPTNIRTDETHKKVCNSSVISRFVVLPELSTWSRRSLELLGRVARVSVGDDVSVELQSRCWLISHGRRAIFWPEIRTIVPNLFSNAHQRLSFHEWIVIFFRSSGSRKGQGNTCYAVEWNVHVPKKERVSSFWNNIFKSSWRIWM